MRIHWGTLLVMGAAALLLNACDSGGGSGSGDSDGSTTVGDTVVGTQDGGGMVAQDAAVGPVDDAGTAVTDAGSGLPPGSDAGSTPVDPPMNADCDQSGFTAAQEIAVIDQGASGTYMIYQAHTSAQPPLDLISIEINAAAAPASGSTVDLTGRANMSLAGADLVVAIASGCGQQGCASWLLADGGTITFTELSQTGSIVATLTNVIFRQVTVDQNTGMASVTPNGATWCLPEWNINSAYEQPPELPKGGPAQPNCVAEGTGNFQFDNVANLQLQNCYGETVSLHDTCGQSKALWMLATAGWCTACDQLIASLKQQFAGADGIMSRASIAAAQPGLDMWVILGENKQSAEPTLQYCEAYAQEKGLDPAMVVIDWVNPEVSVPLVDPEGYAIGTNSLGNVWTVMNPYLVEANGGVTLGFPWSGVLRGSNMEYVWSDYIPGSDINQTLGELLQ